MNGLSPRSIETNEAGKQKQSNDETVKQLKRERYEAGKQRKS
jgi:hypothetical protein